jgi:hypothetical protein
MDDVFCNLTVTLTVTQWRNRSRTTAVGGRQSINPSNTNEVATCCHYMRRSRSPEGLRSSRRSSERIIPALQIHKVAGNGQERIPDVLVAASGRRVAWVSSCLDQGDPHACRPHAIDHYAVQLGADAPVLVRRMHREQVNYAPLSVSIQGIGDEPCYRSILFRDQHGGVLWVSAYTSDLLALLLPPIWVEDSIDAGA